VRRLEERRRRRRPIPPLIEPVRPARATALDRTHPALLLAAAMVASVVVHVAAVRAGGRLRGRDERPPRPVEQIRVAVVERPPEPKPIAAPPSAPGPAPRPRPARTRTPAPTPPAPTPPPTPTPVPEEAPSSAPPVLVDGFSATTPVGGIAVRGGGGPRAGGAASGPGGGGETGEPRGTRGAIAPAYALTEEPVFLDNVSAAEMRRYYPEDARKAKIEGPVRIKLVVADDGSVSRVTVLEDPTGRFADAARRVARLYRFKPAKIDGRPVATEIEFTVHFELE
jgi:protein TonB